MKMICIFLVLAAVIAFSAISSEAAPKSDSIPILAVVPDLANLQKWNDMHGDTADPFWADDDNLYHFTCDGRGFGKESRNLCFNKLTGPDLLHLKGELVNSMDEYGEANKTEADGATWKICGQECIDGVFYGFVARNIYGHLSKDPLLRQTSRDSSLIKSTDHGKTWTRTAKENYEKPMWPGGRFGAPGFIHYGKNGGQVTRDNADKYVYAVSNNGFWNGGDDMVLARVKRSEISKLNASDWQYFMGGDGSKDAAWSKDISQSSPILSLPSKLGWTSPVFIPALNRYLMVSWYVTPTLKAWFEPQVIVYDFYEAERPWGPWSFVSSFDDTFLAPGHMYAPNLCAKYQEKSGDDVKISLFTSGCSFEDVPSGLYKNWRIPLTLKTKTQPHSTRLNNDHPSIRYSGDWQRAEKRGYHDYQDDVHYTKTKGDTCEFTFTGTGVAWISEKFSDMGKADVFIDSKPCGSVDLKTENWPRLSQIRVFKIDGLPNGPHALKIMNNSQDYIIIDAFEVIDGPAPLPGKHKP